MPEFRQKLSALTSGNSKEKAGMVPEIKNLYQGKKDSHNRRPWVETIPDDLAEPVENEKSAKFALLIRNIKCYDGRRALSIESIIIQSPLIRDALKKVLDNYPGITPGVDRMEIKPPFQAFVHRWDKFAAVLDQEEDPATRAHLELLYTVIFDEIRADLIARDNLLAHNVIDFQHLWMLFEPGSIVFSSRLGQPCALRLQSCQLSSNACGRFYQLQCQYVEWNGENFGYASTVQQVMEYQGTCKISQLSTFPLKYHPDVERTTDRLIARGIEFERMAGYHYKAYNGVAVGKGLFGQTVMNVRTERQTLLPKLTALQINSRVIIDTYAWNRFNPNQKVNTNPLENAGLSPGEQSDSSECDLCEVDDDEDLYEDNQDALNAVKQAINPQVRPKLKALTQDQRLLCTNTLKGYALKDKKWLTLFIESVQEIKWSEHAFSKLVLPEDQKELILALTESQRDNRNTFEDIVQGKGMGMIMLLSGPPGVGKTLTAESVSENMKCPLYMMSAGDLGTSAEDVEKNLSTVLEMCTKWKAVLLLDEADVFLEQRTAHNLQRNQLVSSKSMPLQCY